MLLNELLPGDLIRGKSFGDDFCLIIDVGNWPAGPGPSWTGVSFLKLTDLSFREWWIPSETIADDTMHSIVRDGAFLCLQED